MSGLHWWISLRCTPVPRVQAHVQIYFYSNLFQFQGFLGRGDNWYIAGLLGFQWKSQIQRWSPLVNSIFVRLFLTIFFQQKCKCSSMWWSRCTEVETIRSFSNGYCQLCCLKAVHITASFSFRFIPQGLLFSIVIYYFIKIRKKAENENNQTKCLSFKINKNYSLIFMKFVDDIK